MCMLTNRIITQQKFKISLGVSPIAKPFAAIVSHDVSSLVPDDSEHVPGGTSSGVS